MLLKDCSGHIFGVPLRVHQYSRNQLAEHPATLRCRAPTPALQQASPMDPGEACNGMRKHDR